MTLESIMAYAARECYTFNVASRAVDLWREDPEYWAERGYTRLFEEAEKAS